MKWEHREHLIRLGLMVVLLLALGAALLWGGLDEDMATRVESWLGLLGLGVMDSLNVARRQRGARKTMTPPAPDG